MNSNSSGAIPKVMKKYKLKKPLDIVENSNSGYVLEAKMSHQCIPMSDGFSLRSTKSFYL